MSTWRLFNLDSVPGRLFHDEATQLDTRAAGVIKRLIPTEFHDSRTKNVRTELGIIQNSKKMVFFEVRFSLNHVRSTVLQEEPGMIEFNLVGRRKSS